MGYRVVTNQITANKPKELSSLEDCLAESGQVQQRRGSWL